MVIVCISAMDKCYASMWSYGEICVRCNCCGRFDKNPVKKIKARLRYWQESLHNDLNFNDWMEDLETRTIQEKNVKFNIIYAKKKIRNLKNYLKKLEKKEKLKVVDV